MTIFNLSSETDNTFNLSTPQGPVFNLGERPDNTEELSQTEQAIPVTPSVSPQVNWDEVKDLTPDEIVNTPEYMRVVDNALEARYGDRNAIYGTATGILGGATASFRGKSKEERFEIFQNWQRSFAGGQSVTTANELAFSARADTDQWNAVSEGYMLFDKMGNIFTGEGNWGDTFDGVKDYITTALWDPVTVVSLGVGKLLTAGGTKAAATALKEAGKIAFRKELRKKGATKATAEAAEKAAIQAAYRNIPKSKRMLAGVKNLAAYSAVDFAANVGTDIAYQNQMIDARVQKKYSLAQTGFAALGTIAIPSLIAGVKGLAWVRNAVGNGKKKDPIYKHLQNYLEIKDVLNNKTFNEITGEIKKRTYTKGVFSDLKDSFENFRKNKDDFDFWYREVEEGAEAFDGKYGNLDQNTSNFWSMFLFGGENQKGFVHALSDNGFVYINRSDALRRAAFKKGVKVRPPDRKNMGVIKSIDEDSATVRFYNKETGAEQEKVFKLSELSLFSEKGKVNPRLNDNLSNFIGDAMGWTLTDDFVKKFVKDYEATFGALGKPKPTDVKSFVRLFKMRGSQLGIELAQRSKAEAILNKRKFKADYSIQKTLKEEGLEKIAQKEMPEPQKLRYAQSVWKRLLTAHPGTTGLNVKGWAYYNMLNTTSDLVLGGLKLGQAQFYKFKGDDEAYKAALNSGWGSALGGLRRGLNYLNPEATIDRAQEILSLKPEVKEKLFRIIAGDAGDRGAITTFNMNEQSKLLQAVEKGVLTTQQATGVILQDEITKYLSFMTAFDTAIMREYGQTFNEFFSRPDAYVEWLTPRFKERVDAKALDRAQKETASKPWSIKQGESASLAVAKAIEKFSAAPGGGFLLPFGQFFNTSTALLGDYSMFNAVKHLGGVHVFGKKVNFAEDEGMELMAKGLVGWGAMATMFGPAAQKRLSLGFAWNEEEEADGSVSDKTYDWPESYGRIIGQMQAHLSRDGRVPADLITEAVQVLGGQSFRQIDDATKEFALVFANALAGDLGESSRNAAETILTVSSRILSGATRPLDPINQVLLATMGENGQIDRNQENKFFAQSVRYIDGFFGGLDRPDKATPTRGTELQMNYGKTLGGVRETSRPNDVERVLNSLGIPDWLSITWKGDAEVKNTMNAILGQIFNQEAEALLNKKPNFFELPILERRYEYKKIKKRARKRATYMLEMSSSSQSKVIKLKKELAGLPQRDVKDVQRYLGIEGDPMKLADQEGGVEQLELLIHITKNIKEFFMGDFN